jgi:hypothetical protein
MFKFATTSASDGCEESVNAAIFEDVLPKVAAGILFVDAKGEANDVLDVIDEVLLQDAVAVG